MEEVLSQMDASPKMPFRFTQSSRSPSICSLLLEHGWTCWTTPDDWTHYCVHVRVTLGEGRGNQPPPSHTWSGLLITNILQEACPKDYITKAVVLAPGEAILFFGRHSCKEGLLFRNAKDVELGLRGPVNWAGRTAQVEATVNTIQEGHLAIADAIIKKKMKARGHGCPWGLRRVTQSSAAAYHVDDWIQGLDKGVSDEEMRTDDIWTHRYSMLVEVVDDIGSHRSGSEEVTLPTFKDEKSKDAVMYHSWQWDVAIFHWSGWDDQHLLPYIFHSLQGFPGDLARGLGKDATLNDILQMLDKDYGVIMMFNALSKELYSLKQGLSKNIAKFGVHLSQQVQILQSKYPGRIQLEHMEEMKHDHFCEGLNPKY